MGLFLWNNSRARASINLYSGKPIVMSPNEEIDLEKTHKEIYNKELWNYYWQMRVVGIKINKHSKTGLKEEVKELEVEEPKPDIDTSEDQKPEEVLTMESLKKKKQAELLEIAKEKEIEGLSTENSKEEIALAILEKVGQ